MLATWPEVGTLVRGTAGDLWWSGRTRGGPGTWPASPAGGSAVERGQCWSGSHLTPHVSCVTVLHLTCYNVTPYVVTATVPGSTPESQSLGTGF